MKRSTKVSPEVKAVGDRLRGAIDNHSLSVEQVGQKIGLSSSQLYDRMKYGNLKLQEAVVLSQLLDIDLAWLAMGYEEIPNLEGIVTKFIELYQTKPETVESLLTTIDWLWFEERYRGNK
ncbi:helix-turn-helix transcriptional regulator [Spartinivicinus ruber]|uniref:helix-turn-helix transcriptional regulator n=1 Tax=Spartinivicinus ruber TaxID=2683272 RepID=UPI0013D365E6|nr:helix-turn-helix transcriptional regulator [Spartinivicinus ruber]